MLNQEDEREIELKNEKQENLLQQEEAEQEDQIESNISKIVSESITKILIIIIMSMIFCIPLFDWGFFGISIQNYSSLANTLEQNFELYGNFSPSFKNVVLKYVNDHYDLSYPILNITYFTKRLETFYINETINNQTYRREEVETIFSLHGIVSVNYQVLVKSKMENIISLSKTLFICVILVLSSIMFEEDANVLVLQPLGVMTDIINRVVNDPIGARNLDAMNLIQGFDKKKVKDEDEMEMDNLSEAEKKAKLQKMKAEEEKEKKNEQILEEHAEVQVIQKSIIQISALLAIVFGEAGSDIIKANLKSQNDLDPMMKGIKKSAFLGFCDIRGFPLVNEALKEDSIIFVNRIAEIVHKSCDKFGGATNKNIGDAFLSVWKFPEFNARKEKYDINPRNIYSRVVADKAVLSFLYVIRSIKCTEDILKYSKDPRIVKIFEQEHGYKVNMGFGLHFGWAIEGTVGSKHKIDASYLSPNVNIAARLEAATRQYGVTILISGSVYEFLSSELKSMCREIDRVTVKGSINEVRLFTIDVNLNLPKDPKFIKKKKENASITDKIRKFLEKKILYKSYYDKVDELVELNFRTGFFLQNLSCLFENRMSDNFYDKFSYGFDNYIKGKWAEASVYFKKCLLMYEHDLPTQVLIKYMGEHNNKAPRNWKGYRELTSK